MEYSPQPHNAPDAAPTTPKESPFSEVVRFTILSIVIVFFVRMFVAQPFIVSGASMEPTFHNGQYLIVDQLSYQFETPARGDVIVFRYPKDPSKFFIKRVIGLPGETIEIKGDQITIKNKAYPDGFTLSEPYVREMSENNNYTQTLRDDEYFVMGDNRDASADSRMWGVLKKDLITGRALLRLLPVQDASIFPGKASKDQHDVFTTGN